MIKTPRKSAIDTAYFLIDLGIQLIPGIGGSTSSLLKQLISLPYDKKSEQWKNDIAGNIEAINKSINNINPCDLRRISANATIILGSLLDQCPNGLGDESIKIDDLPDVLMDAPNIEIRAALFELQSYDLINVLDMPGCFEVQLKPQAYENFDTLFMPWNTHVDVVSIINEAFRLKNYDASELCLSLGWPQRRFNPPLQMIVNLMPAKCLRELDQWDFVVAGFIESPETSASLIKIKLNYSP